MIIDPYTWNQLTIHHIAPVAEDTLSVRVERPASYTYRAGQYAVMRINIEGTPILRQYSFASSPANDFLEFLIQQEPGGAASNWFHHSAAIGATIEISQPFGSFTVDSEQPSLLFIAGRVGIAPFLSMIRDKLARDGGQNISLLYSARGAEQFCYPELCKSIETTFFDTTASARIDDTALLRHIQPSTRIYLCGSKQFVDSLTSRLLALGVTREHIRRELFTLQ